MFHLKGKKALVTGAAGGLGKAIAHGLYKAGADVCLLDIDDDVLTLKESFKGCESNVYSVIADLSDGEDRKRSFHEALECLGKLDILVNAAGIIEKNPAIDHSLEAFNKVIEINLTAIFDFCQMAGRQMIEQKKGKIINVASMLSFFGGYNVASYSASKGGVAQLTKSLSNEWAKYGIQINAIAPGYMMTKMNKHVLNDSDRYKEITNRIPAGRWGTPEDLEGIAVFLSSEASNYITGAIIPVDGGYLAR